MPPNPTPSTKVDTPRGIRTRVFRAFETILREDPALSRVVRRWATWDGDAINTTPPTISMLPMIRLRPVALPSEEFTQNRRESGMGISVEVLTPGLVIDHVLDVWDLVEAAVVDRKPFRGGTVACFLQQAGVGPYGIVDPAVDPFQSRGADPLKFFAAFGLITAKFLTAR